jgi:hypothetical protein
MGIVAEAVTHKRFANVSDNAEFEKSGVKRVAQIVEAHWANPRAAKRSFPCGLDVVDWLSFESEN